MQTTTHLLMIRPVDFAFNEQTAVSNAFQRRSEQPAIHDMALREFDDFVAVLRNNGVDVTVINDTKLPHTPDSIFPNNWISFHDNSTVFLYPMQAENRRQERRMDVLDQLKEKFDIKNITDLSYFENAHKFLEGTGSMVLDRVNKIAYAGLSPRTDLDVLNHFCEQSGYRAIYFHAMDKNGKEIYHTNVMMCVGTKFVVICLETIPDALEKERVVETINSNRQEVIEITVEQMNRFAGNMLQVKNTDGEELLVMSTSAYRALSDSQIQRLNRYCRLIYSSLDTIESNGGGSARCMMAEIHLPAQQER